MYINIALKCKSHIQTNTHTSTHTHAHTSCGGSFLPETASTSFQCVLAFLRPFYAVTICAQWLVRAVRAKAVTLKSDGRKFTLTHATPFVCTYTMCVRVFCACMFAWVCRTSQINWNAFVSGALAGFRLRTLDPGPTNNQKRGLPHCRTSANADLCPNGTRSSTHAHTRTHSRTRHASRAREQFAHFPYARAFLRGTFLRCVRLLCGWM